MINITIPGRGIFKLSYLLLDFNGTLALDGMLIEGVKPRLLELADKLDIRVLTGDSFGTAREQLVGIPCKIKILPAENQALAKETYIQELDGVEIVAIGNGRNDKQMLERAALSIIVMGNEGCATESLTIANVIMPNILAALDLLLHPKRLIATLRV